jgi:integrase
MVFETKRNILFQDVFSPLKEIKTMPIYKYGKQKELIYLQQFMEILEATRFVKPLRDKSFLAFLYWFGTRKSEALERVKEDFEIENNILRVNAKVKKRGERPALEIPIDLLLVNLIIEKIEKTKPNRRVWNMSPTTAWRIVKRFSDKLYPHYFRLNRASHFLENPETSTAEMMTWFGWRSTKTVDKYVGYSRRHIVTMSSRLKKESQQ